VFGNGNSGWEYEASRRIEEGAGSRKDRMEKRNDSARTKLTSRMTPRSLSISPPVWVTRPV
jgi:hypothetical protein